MAGKKRELGREWADFAACYGFLPFVVNYLTFVQMMLNLERVRFRRADEVALGVQAGGSDDTLDPIWGDAVSCCKEEGDELTHKSNVARMHARINRNRPLSHAAGMGGF